VKTNLITEIRQRLMKLVRMGRVTSYGFLARIYGVSTRVLSGLLERQLVDLCHVVVGREGSVYLLSSNPAICNYQLKKLPISIQPLSIIKDPLILQKILKRVGKNSWLLSDLRIIPIEYVCEEERSFFANYQA
jgi:alkylated DNA nucleotide flippase Atl1